MMRDHYFPNTEALAPDEMRIIALGTGRPFLRPSQANAGWVIELGNGDKFMFDFGFGTQMRFSALEIPYQDMTAYFATHLHTDHVGDFAQIWIGSWAGGRTRPLQMYGPSGPVTKYGFRHFAQRQMESYAWDTDTRMGFLPAVGAQVEVHEFDYSKTQVIYEHNGVRISSFPAVHIYDGPVSLKLEWNGLTFVYSGDTTPSEFMVENAAGADVLVHETFNTVGQLMERSGYDERTARGVGTIAHSDPAEAGEVFARCAPRLAVAFHFFNDFDTAREMEQQVRTRYTGPLVLARDMMVFNVTASAITTRMTVAADDVWPNKERHDEFRQAERRERMKMSRWLADRQLFPKF
ncbi:MAG: guanitoxin biosynthesis MBL fold metallo-hydrolase GntH [Rubrivivax sp.]|jgi:ribonuclease Z